MRKVWAREHETAEGRTEGHHRRRRGLWAGESVEALGKVVASVISGVANCSSFPYFISEFVLHGSFRSVEKCGHNMGVAVTLSSKVTSGDGEEKTVQGTSRERIKTPYT